MIYQALRNERGEVVFSGPLRNDGRSGRLECEWCGGVIRKGSHYRLHAELDDGTKLAAHDACAIESMGYA